MDTERLHESYIYLFHLLLRQMALIVAEPADIHRGDLLTESRRAPTNAFDPHMSGHGLFVLAGQVHDLDHRAVLIALWIGYDNGGPAGPLLGADGLTAIHIEYIATVDFHKQVFLSIITNFCLARRHRSLHRI